MAFTLQIGQSAPNFENLPGVDGKDYSLADFKDSGILIVVFSCNHCPFVIGSQGRLNALYADYVPRGAGMIAINSNETENHPTDTLEHMVRNAKDKGFRFPYVRDESQDVALAYGALCTPHFFVFDAERQLRYTGRMDDNPRTAGKETTHELRDALDALLNGEEPPVTVTNPIGCNIKWMGKPEHWMPPEACDLI